MATPFERLEGKYEILEKIREGGMGSVYKVRHRLLEEVRVVKVMRPHLADDEVLRERFLREAKVAIKLRHPNLAQIYDFTMDDSGYAYLVMEFIDGFALQEMVKVLGKPPLALVLEVARQSLDALGYLHRKRIIHRDVSPDNLLVTRDDEGHLQVKLIDLGIAKVHHDGDDSLTSAGTFLGKVRYSSPEHFKTHEGAAISAVSDLYSFGVVLYEILTGTYPIQGTSVASLISGHLIHPPHDFERSDPDGLVPDRVRTVVMRSLEKDPGERFSSAAKMKEALEKIRKENRLQEETLSALFEIPNLTTRKIETVKKPGSTQSRMDRSFGVATTPPPGEISDIDSDFESSGTIETSGSGAEVAEVTAKAPKPQIRALLLGADKLIQGKHFNEARLQLTSVLELDPDNSEALSLVKAVEAADTKTRQRRQRAADAARGAIRKEDFDAAAVEIAKATAAYGDAEIFDEVRTELDEAQRAVEKRQQRVADILSEATALSSDEAHQSAVDLLREGLGLDPANRQLREKLDVAEKNLAGQLEAQKRAKEIDQSAETILKHIAAGEPSEAERALAVARKLFGDGEVFSDLETRLEELRHKQRLDRAADLRKTAREEMKAERFKEAVAMLEEARDQAPEVSSTEGLLAEAREGQRLQEEEAKRQKEIDRILVKIERLETAGRHESALQLLEDACGELGTFDQAEATRKQLDREIARRGKAEKTIRTAIKTALASAADDSFSDANEKLDEARKIASDHPELRGWIQEAETEIGRRLEAHRRQMALDKVVESVEEQVLGGNTEEARRELAVAKRLYGTSDVLDDLRTKIENRERELRREEVETLVKNALKKNRSPDDVIADLDTAASIDPNNEKVQRLIVEARSAQRQKVEEKLAADHQPVLREIDQLIADGETEKALQRLNALTTEFGDFETARWLKQRLGGSSKKIS